MPKTVLVADDSITIRKVIGMLFATEDFQTTMVDNGLDCIAKAREMKPDLVLADCMMPGKNGYEVCEALKQDPSTSQIPVLLLAGTFEPFDEARARSVGANAHLQKPFDSTSFLDRVKGLVGIPGTSAIPTGYGTVSTVAAPMAGAPAVVPAVAARPPHGIPPGTQPGVRPAGLPPPPSAVAPPRAPMGMGPPGMRPPGAPGMAHPAQPGMMRPPGQPGMPPPGMRPPGQPGMAPGQPGMMRPPGQPGMMHPGQPGMMRPPGQPGMPPQGFPRPPGGAPLPGQAPVRRDPFGLGAAPGPGLPRPPMQQHQRMQQHTESLSLDDRADGGEAILRDALSRASKEVIEKIAWEVVPQLAETIIREELERLIKERDGKGRS